MRHLQKTNLRYPSLWRSCVGAWAPCVGVTGNTLLDFSGYKNHCGNVQASQWQPSGRTYATVFTGSESYTIPHQSHLLPSYALSIVVFAKVDSTTGNPFLVDKDYNSAYYMQAYGTNQIEFGARFTVGGYISSGTNVFTLGKTACFIGTFNSLSDTARIYVGGIQKAESLSATAAMPAGTGEIRVGRRQSVAGSYLSGAIHEVRIYARELTPTEVSILSLRPGIAYETERNRTYSFVTSGNRRRRVLLGAIS